MKTTISIILVLLLCCTLSGFVTAADTVSNTTGNLKIASNPGGATVTLDGVYKGITPEPKSYLIIVNLTPKSYTLDLKKDGYLEYISTVKIVAGQDVSVSADMTPAGTTTTSETGMSTAGVFIVIILVLLVAGFLALYIRKHRKKEEPKKVELD